MGSFHGESLRKIVVLYLLNKLSLLLGKDSVGLYRDNGLATVSSCSELALYENEGLNLIETDFLDVSFNLTTEKFFPYRKPCNSMQNQTTLQMAFMTNSRLSDLSCDEEESQKVRP